MRFGPILALLAVLVGTLFWFSSNQDNNAKENEAAFQNLFGKKATQEQVLDQISELDVMCEIAQIDERSYKTTIKSKYPNSPPFPWDGSPVEGGAQSLKLERNSRQICSLFSYAKEVAKQRNYYKKFQ
ncbi:MAG: hypothetical protein AAB350_00750 [Patescibacteria group bacterium]